MSDLVLTSSGYLQAEVYWHEPHQALDGGGKAGLDCLNDICGGAAKYLRPGGFLGLETGGKPFVHGSPNLCSAIFQQFASSQANQNSFTETRMFCGQQHQAGDDDSEILVEVTWHSFRENAQNHMSL